MFDVKVDRKDPALLHDQVAAQIRRAIADGEAMPGERLPPARHLAAVMQVNTNTVLRALRLLRDEGLLELRRGHGIRVTGTPERTALLMKAIELVALGRDSGYDRAELLEIIRGLP
jgi:GntR family transcriptional regulator